MSVTSGFFNSLNHDRRYNAQQLAAIFDGIINDGVFANIGKAFAVSADTGVTITIGEGRAWFNSAWVYNDSLLPKGLEGSEVVLDRIDAVVIEIDHNDAVRLGDIKIVKGTPSSSPQRPDMVNTDKKHQHPLAYIYRKAGSTEITPADITNMVGTSSCPYVTGILQVQNIDNIVAQWGAQWNRWYSEKVSETDADASEILADMKSTFDIWFADVRAILNADVTTALTEKVVELQGKFDDLARDGAVYDTIEDSNLDILLSSDGTPIYGRTVIGSDTPKSDLDAFEANVNTKFTALETVVASKASTDVLYATLTANGWSDAAPYTQQVTVNGLLYDDTPFVDIDLGRAENADITIEAWGAVGRVTVSANNTIVAYCYRSAPTADIPIILKVVR